MRQTCLRIDIKANVHGEGSIETLMSVCKSKIQSPSGNELDRLGLMVILEADPPTLVDIAFAFSAVAPSRR